MTATTPAALDALAAKDRIMGIEDRLSNASRRSGYPEEYSDWQELCRDGLSAIYTLKGKLKAADTARASAETALGEVRSALKEAERIVAYHADLAGDFDGHGSPQSCLTMIRAALEKRT